MFKVVWKSFKYNRKNFLSFFMSEILSVAVIFMLIYIQEALSQVPGIKTEALQFAYQSELRKQLRIIIRMDFMHIWNYFYDIYYFFNQAFMERNFKNMG